MTLDAMHWVWNHSQSKGNSRIALLYVADQVRTSAAEVRVGHRELMKALNTNSKGTAEAAVRKAVELGELELMDESTGRRPSLYRMPKAVGYMRVLPSSAPKTGAQDFASAPESGAQDADQGPRSAPKTGAQENRSAPVFNACAPKTGAPPHTHKELAGAEAAEPDAFQICQPLVTAMTNAGITVSWSMQAADWLEIGAIVKRAGVPAMVEFARITKASTRQPVRYATFFLRGGWKGLPPAPTGQQIGPASARQKPPHCGDPDCDPVDRFRELEDENGMRMNTPCPECHPTRKEYRAA